MYNRDWGNLPPAPYVSDPRIKGSKTGNWRALRPVVNHEECTRCGLCSTFCPDGVAEVFSEKIVIDYDYCKGCGVCAEECPSDCIEMVKEA
jgi:pyruvate ferredoxin oxidoreductase delta subunit